MNLKKMMSVTVSIALAAVAADATILSLNPWENGSPGWTFGGSGAANNVLSDQPAASRAYGSYNMGMQERSMEIRGLLGTDPAALSRSYDFTGVTDLYVAFLLDMTAARPNKQNYVAFNADGGSTVATLGYTGTGWDYGVSINGSSTTIPLTPSLVDDTLNLTFVVGRLYDSDAGGNFDTFDLWVNPSYGLGAPIASANLPGGFALDGTVRFGQQNAGGAGGYVQYGHFTLGTSSDDIVAVPEAAAFWPGLIALVGAGSTYAVRRLRKAKMA